MFVVNHEKQTVEEVVRILREAADKLESGDAALNQCNVTTKREFSHFDINTKEIELSFLEVNE